MTLTFVDILYFPYLRLQILKPEIVLLTGTHILEPNKHINLGMVVRIQDIDLFEKKGGIFKYIFANKFMRNLLVLFSPLSFFFPFSFDYFEHRLLSFIKGILQCTILAFF